MAKKNIHPKTYDIKIKFPDGSEIDAKSTVNKDQFAEFKKFDHPAWKDGPIKIENLRSSAAQAMAKQFAGLSDVFKKNTKE